MTPTNAKQRGLNPYVALVTGILGVSSAAPLIRAALGEGMPPTIIASLRLTMASLVLSGPALVRARHEYSRLDGRDVLLAVLSGVLLAVQRCRVVASRAALRRFATVRSRARGAPPGTRTHGRLRRGARSGAALPTIPGPG